MRSYGIVPSLGAGLIRSAPGFSTSMSTPTRRFASRIGDSVMNKVSDSVEKLTRHAYFQDERMVTESRRKLERFRTAPETLAQRLASQRSVRRFLIPSDIKIDKTKQYIEFTWPEEALEAAALLEKADREWRKQQERADRTDGQAEGMLNSTLPAVASSDTVMAASPAAPGADALPSPSEAKAVSGAASSATPPRWLRTRALAEYLRAYTPSTDGRYGTPRIVIYGRRGLTITDAYPVGNYALRVIFSDGHTGGIYSYEYLYFLTASTNKYGLMRNYIRELRETRKSRDPPRRGPSRRKLPQNAPSAAEAQTARDRDVGRHSVDDRGGEGGHLAPSYPRE